MTGDSIFILLISSEVLFVCFKELSGPVGYGFKASGEEAERLRLVYKSKTSYELSVVIQPLNSVDNVLGL